MDMKARVKATSEIGEVLCWADCSHEKISMYLENSVCDIPYSDIEVISIDNTTDWQQVRIQAAIAAMQGILSDEDEVGYACSEATYKENEKHTIPVAVARFAAACADALVEELKQ